MHVSTHMIVPMVINLEQLTRGETSTVTYEAVWVILLTRTLRKDL